MCGMETNRDNAYLLLLAGAASLSFRGCGAKVDGRSARVPIVWQAKSAAVGKRGRQLVLL